MVGSALTLTCTSVHDVPCCAALVAEPSKARNAVHGVAVLEPAMLSYASWIQGLR